MLIDFIFILYVTIFHLHSINNILQAIQLDKHKCHALITPILIGDVFYIELQLLQVSISITWLSYSDHEIGRMTGSIRIVPFYQLFLCPYIMLCTDNLTEIAHEFLSLDIQEQILRLVPWRIGNFIQRYVVPKIVKCPLTLLFTASNRVALQATCQFSSVQPAQPLIDSNRPS